jgi:alpha-1,6-mannosyltransferase
VKVLNVTEFYSERGGGVRSHLTLKGQVSCQLGHEHVIVAPGPIDKDERLREQRVIRIAGPALPYDPTYHLLWRVDKVRSIVKREAPDVLEIDSPYAAAASCLSVPRECFGVRTFVWHSDFIDTYLQAALVERAGVSRTTASAVLEPVWSVVRSIASRCDATLVAAKWIEAKLKGHGLPRVVRVPFGIERSAFSPSRRSEEVRRSLLGDCHGAAPALLLGVGRLAFEKRWDVVLDAFEAVQRETPCVLVLFGDGPEREALAARARATNLDVRLVGFETDRGKLAAALASADLLVHGCPYETFGFAVAEAMSSGLPAVVPDAGGAGELADDAWSARYVAGDAASCARAIQGMLKRVSGRDGDRVRAGAASAASKLPTVRQQFEATYEAYRGLLAERGARSPVGLSLSS